MLDEWLLSLFPVMLGEPLYHRITGLVVRFPQDLERMRGRFGLPRGRWWGGFWLLLGRGGPGRGGGGGLVVRDTATVQAHSSLTCNPGLFDELGMMGLQSKLRTTGPNAQSAARWPGRSYYGAVHDSKILPPGEFSPGSTVTSSILKSSPALSLAVPRRGKWSHP